jgi:alpha-tubulin suppressor-like RCC1 family protein
MKALIVAGLLVGACSDPFAAGSARAYKAVTTGGEHSCAVSESGEAYCWGRGMDGELGHGAKENRATPVKVTGNITFDDIAAGSNHTCGLAATGRVYCWGWNVFYQRGNPTDPRDSEPVPVADSVRYIAITSGDHHSCALAVDSLAYCWGYNRFGQLGSGNQSTGVRPNPVLGAIKFAGISGGGAHTCGWTAQGVGYCWGHNDLGQLGINLDVVTVNVPMLIATPVRFRQIDAGATHTCGAGVDGGLWCWGSAGNGELGNGGAFSPNLPGASVPVRLSPLLPSGQAAYAGPNHSCAVREDGRGFCWGRGQYGQLGNGSTGDNYVPQPIHLQPEVLHSGELLRFAEIAPGGTTHTCGLADRSVYCWGTGLHGQLGVNGSRFALMPQRVAD